VQFPVAGRALFFGLDSARLELFLGLEVKKHESERIVVE
jgi:hypothetical protein